MERCTWCGTVVDGEEGFRLLDPVAGRRAVFCRLEHIVPWVLRGARWLPGTELTATDGGTGLGCCARCGDGLQDDRVVLVRHRAGHRIGDALCGLDHLLDWAKDGGRFAAGSR